MLKKDLRGLSEAQSRVVWQCAPRDVVELGLQPFVGSDDVRKIMRDNALSLMDPGWSKVASSAAARWSWPFGERVVSESGELQLWLSGLDVQNRHCNRAL